MFETETADAVYITDDSPDALRFAELSLKALKHVFIVNPDRFSLTQMQYLKKLAEESGVVLQLGAGYKFCPVYCYMLTESSQTAKLIDIRHKLTNRCNLRMEIFYVLDFITGILNVSILKFVVRSWKNPENLIDMLYYRLDCDNGSVVNITAYTVFDSTPKLEINFASSETVIFADVFKSEIKKQYRTHDASDSIILDAYCEKTVNEKYLQNFYCAINKDSDAVKTTDKHFQNMISSFTIYNTQ